MVLLGKSVVASSLASTLKCRPETEVVQFDAASPLVLEWLRDAHPDAILLCGLETASPDLLFLLLRGHPGVPVIEADVDGDRMVVLSGRQAVLRTEDDLLEAIGQGQPLPEECQDASEEKRERVVDAAEQKEEPRQPWELG